MYRFKIQGFFCHCSTQRILTQIMTSACSDVVGNCRLDITNVMCMSVLSKKGSVLFQINAENLSAASLCDVSVVWGSSAKRLGFQAVMKVRTFYLLNYSQN